jgi:hypothetical protein
MIVYGVQPAAFISSISGLLPTILLISAWLFSVLILRGTLKRRSVSAPFAPWVYSQ